MVYDRNKSFIRANLGELQAFVRDISWYHYYWQSSQMHQFDKAELYCI